MIAVWNSRVIADSEETFEIDGDTYFPVTDVDMSYLKMSENRTFCQDKGEATWFHVTDGDFLLENGAWTYSEPPEGENRVRNFIAFDSKISVQ